MRVSVILGLAWAGLCWSGLAIAQTEAVNPQAARKAEDAASMTPQTEAVSPDDRAAPPAASLNGQDRILSKNEAYNRARAAEGRVGVRLGNDMSFRISGD
ncbi:hypothetical protein [Sphingomonas faeni]|uniref:hypothetical protein n=1 Tax=Sphingomonas faeni TaxID=185950 RepID=UPI00335E47F6